MTDSYSTSIPLSGRALPGRLAQAPARRLAGVAAVALGIALYVGTGFAAPSFIHNATHDTRHALGLPCH